MLARGRVIQLATDTQVSKGCSARALPGGHVVAREITEAAVRARKIMADAQAHVARERLDFEKDIESIRSDLSNLARTEAESSLTDKLFEVARLRQLMVERAEDDIIALARVLAERVIGEELVLRPEGILLLAKQCIREGRGSSRLSLYAHPADAAYLRQQLDKLSVDDAVELQIQSEPELRQGDLRVETDVGTIDARIGTQLANLAAKIRESFRV